MDARKLWVAGGVIFIGGYAWKLALWNRVKEQIVEGASKSHTQAVQALHEAHEEGRRWNLPRLTEEQRFKVQRRVEAEAVAEAAVAAAEQGAKAVRGQQ